MAAVAPLPAYAAPIAADGRETAPQPPVARGVLYWMEGCGHCEEVLNGVVPDLQAQYGSQLEIQLIEVVTLEDTDQLYATAAAHGVPIVLAGTFAGVLKGLLAVGRWSHISAQPEKYGHEVFETLYSGGYTVYPINPKYMEIAGCRCYASLAELPAMPDAVVLALAPHVTEQTTPKVIAAGARLVWLPPGCFTNAAVEACQAAGVPVIHDVCPVGALRALQMLDASDAPA